MKCYGLTRNIEAHQLMSVHLLPHQLPERTIPLSPAPILLHVKLEQILHPPFANLVQLDRYGRNWNCYCSKVVLRKLLVLTCSFNSVKQGGMEEELNDRNDLWTGSLSFLGLQHSENVMNRASLTLSIFLWMYILHVNSSISLNVCSVTALFAMSTNDLHLSLIHISEPTRPY